MTADLDAWRILHGGAGKQSPVKPAGGNILLGNRREPSHRKTRTKFQEREWGATVDSGDHCFAIFWKSSLAASFQQRSTFPKPGAVERHRMEGFPTCSEGKLSRHAPPQY